MKRRGWLIAALLFYLLSTGVGPVEAGWVWTPQTGWIGPSGVVKDTPQEQLAYALSLFQKAEYDKAKIEFKKLLHHFKESREAAEGQYYLGRCEEEERDYYAAFLAYRKTIQVYPSTSRFEESLERMYQIGNYFLGGKRRKILGTVAIMPARDKAIEIFRAITEEGPFSEHGELAQYKLGLAYLALGEYEQAVTTFEQLIDRYPKSTLVDDARFQIAQASLKGVFKPVYDQHPTQQAIEELNSFVQEYPNSELSPEAAARVQSLREREAEHEFQIAQFYERRKQVASALIYYQELVLRYADTTWATKASARLEALQSK